MARDAEVVVVGAGVVGLAAAAALARDGRDVLVLERNAGIAREVTARNSEVIHAGIYYAAGSLKAELCVRGRRAVYERCASLGIPHRRLGKLVVATDDEELAALETLLGRGRDNGVEGLRLVDAAEVRRREPWVRGRGALYSPQSGIVDAHALSVSFAAEAESRGAVIALRTDVREIEARGGGYRLGVLDADGAAAAVSAAAVVNAAGLAADRVAACAGFDVDALGYRQHPCKGDYFTLAPGAPVRVNGLVYPLPPAVGLGVHATVDLGGRVRFGPDATYVSDLDYRVDPDKAGEFAAAVRRYLPDVSADQLAPDTSGIRPRLAGPGEAFRDFVVAEESAHGYPGFVNLVGIESPGLTAAPAIAERVVGLLSGLA